MKTITLKTMVMKKKDNNNQKKNKEGKTKNKYNVYTLGDNLCAPNVTYMYTIGENAKKILKKSFFMWNVFFSFSYL